MASLTQRSAIYPALVLIFASFPLISETAGFYIVYSVIGLLLFPFYALISTREVKHSLVQDLYQHHPLLFFALLGFFFSSLCSLFLVLFESNSFERKVLALIRYLSCVFLTVYVFALARFMLMHSQQLVAQLFTAIAVGVVGLIAILLAFYTFHPSSQFYVQHWWVSPPAGMHIRIMGMMASVGVASSLVHVAMSSQCSRIVGVHCALLFFSWALLIWTGGRISILASALLVLITLSLARAWLKISFKKVWLLVFILFVATVMAELLAVMQLNGLMRLFQGFNALGTDDLTALSEELGSGRWQQWMAALAEVSQSPWFGLGPFGYFFIDRPTSAFHTHNFVVESLVEWGVIGTTFLMFCLLYMVWYGLRKIKVAVRYGDVNYMVAAAVIFVLTLTSMADGVYFLLLPAYIALTGFACFPFYTQEYMRKVRENS